MGLVKGIVSPLTGFFGFYLSFTSITPITRLSTYYLNTRKAWGEAAQANFARASLPRRIFYLLVAVAECDGPMTPAEREIVRQFLLQRFDNPIHGEEIRSWEMQPLQVEDRVGLAARIATVLDESELDSLFCWCALVTFADGKFRTPEHRALADVARGLHIAGPRARMLFHLARAQFMGNPHHQQGSEGRRQTAGAQSFDRRRDACSVLGLPPNASADQIRRRHRELVRKFHPDAQPNLGPVAQQEATDRFQAIQRAYEVLTTKS